jgi:PAS domain S-box-containing protein
VGTGADPLAEPAIFRHGGEVGADLAKVDWASTPLGKPADWPQSLRTTVDTLLSSRFPMWMAWGPELTFFCNNAYRRDTLRRKYPWALGRPASQVWEEVWPDVSSRADRVLSAGESTWDAGLQLFLERSGYTEETYHTFSYSPLRDDGDSVVGLLCVVSEDTGRVIGERRMATLRDLGSDPSVVRTEEDVLAFTARQLAHNQKDLPFTLTYLLDGSGTARLAASSGLPAGHPSAPATICVGGEAIWPIREAVGGASVIVDLGSPVFGTLPGGAWTEPPLQAIVTPLVAQGGTTLGLLVAGLNRYRPVDEDYRGFLALVAAHIANGVASARRNRDARWRTALIDSLQEAFFVCRGDGTMIEFNDCFADMVGYGPEGLPYSPPFPWWPDPITHAADHRRIHNAFYDAMDTDLDPTPFVIQHRDGHLLWVDITSTRTEDPTTGEFVTVGTFRDVTDEHYRVQRQTALSELNEQLAQAESLPETVDAAARRLHRIFDATRVLAATFPPNDTATQPDLVCAGDATRWGELADTTRERIRALAVESDALVPDLRTPGTAGIMLQHPEGALALWIEMRHQRLLTSEEQTLLTVLASRLAQGLQRVHQIGQQRETALALQHAILGPADLPVGFAARYQPATRPLEVGGDWYDVAPIGDGRIAMVVGDCVGHGLSAATVMGQLRSACRALLLQRLDPAETLAGLDRFAAGMAGAPCTTACAAVLDTHTGELTYSVAGHPPPVLVSPDGTHIVLDEARSLPLAVGHDRRRLVARVTVPAGATLLLYTDGLVERRQNSLDSGIARAAEVLAAQSDRGLQDSADELMTALMPYGGYRDDVAILLYRRPRPLELSFPPLAGQIAPARAELRNWLATIGVSDDLAADVLLAAGEAVGNAVEHGHRDIADGAVILRAEVSGAALHVSVTDTGRWREPKTDARRGRGISFMRAVMSDVVLESTAAGTTVQMSVNLQ